MRNHQLPVADGSSLGRPGRRLEEIVPDPVPDCGEVLHDIGVKLWSAILHKRTKRCFANPVYEARFFDVREEILHGTPPVIWHDISLSHTEFSDVLLAAEDSSEQAA